MHLSLTPSALPRHAPAASVPSSCPTSAPLPSLRPSQHTAFMAICLLSEINSVFRLAGKLLALARRGESGSSRLNAATAVLAAADRITFVIFR